MSEKKGFEITIGTLDPKQLSQENLELTRRIEMLEGEAQEFLQQIEDLESHYNSAMKQNEQYRQILDSSGIPYDDKSAQFRKSSQNYSELTTQNEKLRQILNAEGIEFDEKTLMFKTSKTRLMLSRAIKEVNRLRKLVKIPVLDLWDAVERGSIAYAKYFLQEDPTTVFVLKNGTSALHRAIELGNMAMIKYLIEHGASYSTPTENGTTSLMLAARSGNLDVFNYIYEKTENKDAKRPDGLTSLHCAISGGNIYIIKYLITKGFDINAPTITGVTPILCLEEYNPTVFDYLIECGADIRAKTVSNKTLLHIACAIGSYEFVDRLVSLGLPLDSVTKDGCNALHMATVGGNINIIESLLREDYGFHIDDRTSLGFTPFLISVQAEDIDLAKFLLAHGADMTTTLENGRSALHIAVATSNIEMCKFLLDSGLPIDAIDKDSSTPIMIAYSERCLPMIEFLLSRGATPNEDFMEAEKNSVPSPGQLRVKLLYDPTEELPKLRKENEELKRMQVDMRKVIEDYEKEHPIIVYSELGTQTLNSGIISKRMVSQIGIVTYAPQKEQQQKLKMLQDENKKLMNEISELTEIVGNYNQVKANLATAQEDLTKANDEKLEIEKKYKGKKRKIEAENKKIKRIMEGMGAGIVALLAVIIYLFLNYSQ
ncbi:hypothetical protein TVAG_339300 [Trichomonas vaginalis G3]|uniref:Uncharacterized protein n=1 Tax=Trichomonas vaginalis (strain ATCC PRA-98 / G3) TaxID=412133 RepID=A2F8Y6_TRIV3|nr:spectrin binding [Trichomonas vaginalis G3]EAX98613.1 hypothetical protein TVAG_339300 [Trichomonas vaginalis G3]KAI5513410.1 spectrin binding [Trichomonas vaginalis G3]|eukprot:XP_001311543.1 hypothetical protein [Trichomonas vaginalis G3]